MDRCSLDCFRRSTLVLPDRTAPRRRAPCSPDRERASSRSASLHLGGDHLTRLPPGEHRGSHCGVAALLLESHGSGPTIVEADCPRARRRARPTDGQEQSIRVVVHVVIDSDPIVVRCCFDVRSRQFGFLGRHRRSRRCTAVNIVDPHIPGSNAVNAASSAPCGSLHCCLVPGPDGLLPDPPHRPGHIAHLVCALIGSTRKTAACPSPSARSSGPPAGILMKWLACLPSAE
jgi:hypothetical protein